MRGIDTPQPLTRYRQRGSVLGIALIFLLLMTILGVSAMQGTTMQERMAGNQRDRDIAFQAAEAALREGEAWISDSTNRETANNREPLQTPSTWDGDDPEPINDDPQKKFYVSPPRQSRIGIELPATYRTIYPITARAVGATDSAIVILESMYKPE